MLFHFAKVVSKFITFRKKKKSTASMVEESLTDPDIENGAYSYDDGTATAM